MNKQALLDSLCKQQLVDGETKLAEKLLQSAQIETVPIGTEIISEGSQTSDLFLILSGSFGVFVGGAEIAQRVAGSHAGEMALVDPESRRSATVAAKEESCLARVSASQFENLALENPLLWRRIAADLAARVREMNQWLVTHELVPPHEFDED